MDVRTHTIPAGHRDLLMHCEPAPAYYVEGKEHH